MLTAEDLRAWIFNVSTMKAVGDERACCVPEVCESRIFNREKALPLAHAPDVDVHEVRTTDFNERST